MYVTLITIDCKIVIALVECIFVVPSVFNMVRPIKEETTVLIPAEEILIFPVASILSFDVIRPDAKASPSVVEV